MTLAIEPMITAGGVDIVLDDDQWSVYTADGSLSAHFEHTVAVTEAGPRILTPARSRFATVVVGRKAIFSCSFPGSREPGS